MRIMLKYRCNKHDCNKVASCSIREKNFVVLFINNDREIFIATFISDTSVISCIKRRIRLKEMNKFKFRLVKIIR